MTMYLTDDELRGALRDYALMLGMERDMPPTKPMGHKLLEMLLTGERTTKALLETRAALRTFYQSSGRQNCECDKCSAVRVALGEQPMTDAERLAKLRAAVDEAMARLWDMRSLAVVDGDWPHTLAEAQTIVGDAWRILDKAMKETA